MPSSFVRTSVFALIAFAAAAVPARAQRTVPPPPSAPPVQAPAQTPAQNPAPQAPAPPPEIKETVQVVATKVPEAPKDVPAPIEVITGQQLHDMGATTLRQALALATGVEIAPGGDGGAATSVPEFWGLREFDAFLLVVDDVPWGGAFNPALASLSLRDVDRIEILRGPAPVTYGATSFVGVIHVVHKPASANTNYFSASLGTLSSGSAGADVVVPTGGAWKSRLTADFNRQGFKDERTSYGRGHALWRSSKIDADRSMWFTGDLSITRQDPASPAPLSGGALSTVVPLDANYNPANAFLNENRINLGWGTERPFMTDMRLAATASLTHTSQQVFRGFLTNVADGANNATGFRENIGITDFYGDVHLQLREQHHVRSIVGADFLHGNGDGKGSVFTYTAALSGVPAPAVTEPSAFDIGSDDNRNLVGLYANGEWKPTAKLTGTAGVRLNMTFEEGGDAEPLATQGTQKEQGVTHVRPGLNLGAIYSLWERGTDYAHVYADYRNTFKLAAFDFGLGANEGSDDAAEEAGRLLDPETAQSIEAGVKTKLMNGKAGVDASVFRLDFHNLVAATVVNGLPALTNTGHTRFTGIDLGADYKGPYDLTGRVTYSFHDGTFVDFAPAVEGVPVQLAGNRVEMSARQLFSAGVIMSPELGYFGSFVVKYVGNRAVDRQNLAFAPGYATIDLGVGYRFDKYELRLDGRNLGDRRDPVSLSELGPGQYYLMFPRELTLTLGVKF
jgi:outer membrane receptor protein involved in Fe transport